jgi:DNA-binding MarR family transcriptional regulator
MNKYFYEDLVCLVTFYESDNITKTANRLGVHPSTVIRKIQRLEEHLQVILIKKNGSRYILTKDGERYIKQAAKIVSDMDKLQTPSFFSDHGSISFYLPFTYGMYFSRYIVPIIQNRLKNISIRINSYSFASLKNFGYTNNEMNQNDFVLLPQLALTNYDLDIWKVIDSYEDSFVMFGSKKSAANITEIGCIRDYNLCISSYQFKKNVTLKRGGSVIDLPNNKVILSSDSEINLISKVSHSKNDIAIASRHNCAMWCRATDNNNLVHILDDWRGMKTNSYLLYNSLSVEKSSVVEAVKDIMKEISNEQFDIINNYKFGN